MHSVLLLAAVLSTSLWAQGRGVLALTHVNVVDVPTGDLRPDMTVVVANGRIRDVEPSSARAAPSGAQVYDATGKFLIPGLWDMHAHWLLEPSLLLFVANGVTGMRVMWGVPRHHEWRKAIDRGRLVGPRLVIGSAIIDGPNPFWPGSVVAGTAAEGRAAVADAEREGADFVKVYGLLPREAYFAIADESRRRGIPFAGHVPNAISAAEASDAGQASIEHLTGVLMASSDHEADLQVRQARVFRDRPAGSTVAPASLVPIRREMLGTFNPQKAADLFARFRRNHTWQTPTLTVLRSTALRAGSDMANDPRLRYVPVEMAQRWRTTARMEGARRSVDEQELGRAIYRKNVELVGAMHRAGVELLAGTDVSNPFCLPGFSLHDELALLVEAGLTPLDALRTATLNPARFLKKEADTGTIAAGKVADLVVLDADPLLNITNTTRIRAVIAGGRYYDRPALDRMLSAAASRRD